MLPLRQYIHLPISPAGPPLPTTSEYSAVDRSLQHWYSVTLSWSSRSVQRRWAIIFFKLRECTGHYSGAAYYPDMGTVITGPVIN